MNSEWIERFSLQIKLKILLLASTLFVVSCTSSSSRTPPAWVGFTETGIASYYAMKYQFRQTASGERFNQLSKTAAHKQVPFGSNVKVTNLENGESVFVRVNDRGPFIEGRIIDLSRSAFASIADVDQGLVDVRIEVVD